MAESGAQVMRHTIYTVLVFVLLTYLLFHVALYSQLFSRLGAKELLGDLGLPLFSQLTPVTHSDAVLRPGDVIEFCGAEGTAKSELLLNIAVRCVLPKTWKGKRLGGKETEVVFISTDFKFDLFRLSQILEGHLHEALETQPLDQTTPQASPSKDEYKEVISLSLARVHVLYCNSSTELTVTLQSLKTFFHNHPGVCVLMVDNVAAYYWTDRARTASRLEECQLQWIKLLSQLRLDYHLVVFAAKPLLLQRQENATHGAVEFMPKLWQKAVTFRFCLERAHAQQVTATSKQPMSMFIAHRVSPAGPSHMFKVSDCGLKFI